MIQMRSAVDYCRVLLVIVLSVVAGCQDADSNRNRDTKVPDAPGALRKTGAANTGSPTVSASGEILIDGIYFTLPEGWEQQQLDPNMRQFIAAKITLPAPDVTLSLSSVGGGIDANLARWFGQFPDSEPDVETLTVDGHSAKWVDLRGQFSSSTGVGPGSRADWMMLGVAIQSSSSDFYIKLTGPRAQVSKFAEQLREFVNSARFQTRA